VIEEFQRNQKDFQWQIVDDNVRDAAANLGWATGSRGMESIHVATAHIGLADCFLTADKRQHTVALAAGLNSYLIES
jgi:hypothetical protein